jgi:hypothetical protein
MWINAAYRGRSTSNAGEHVAEIYRKLWEYNTGIQFGLKRSLSVFAEQIAA